MIIQVLCSAENILSVDRDVAINPYLPEAKTLFIEPSRFPNGARHSL
jgi:hypothetical protein